MHKKTILPREKLIAARKNSNPSLTQEQVASTVGISFRNYQGIELGECAPNINTVLKIAKVLDRPVEELFGEDNTQEDFSTKQDPALAAAKLSEVPASHMVTAALDLRDGRVDTEEGREVLGLIKVVGGAALV